MKNLLLTIFTVALIVSCTGKPEPFYKLYIWNGTYEDVSIAGAKRTIARITLPDSLNDATLRAQLEDAVTQVRRFSKAHASTVFAYRKGEDMQGAYTIGKATIAPGGDWSKAGQGGAHKVVIEISDTYLLYKSP